MALPAAAANESSDDDADLVAAIALASRLVEAALELEPRRSRQRARRLVRLLDDDASMAFSLALTDEVARIADPARATRRLEDLVRAEGLPTFLGPLDRLVLRAATIAGRVAPGPVARGVQWRLRRESAGVVLPAEDPAFAEHLRDRRERGIGLNVNVLGEAILGDGEARRRLEEVLSRVERPDVDYVSVKVSSICAQVSSVGFDRSVERIVERLRELYRRAATATPPVFVNLDMEEHRDLELTLESFVRVLDEPGLSSVDAGIVLQAYLPESHEAFERLATWARTRHERTGGRIKVRLVKGANLAMEQVDGELHGWSQAPYRSKAEVDASYKRLLDRALDPEWGDAVRVGLGSHNLFDVAWGLVRADRTGARDRLELEMLEGMASGATEAARRQAGGIRLYAPVVRHDEFDAAIAYLVRRLDESTSPDNFLRHQFELRPGSRAFADQRDRFAASVPARRSIGIVPRRNQDRATERRHFDLATSFVNEPDTDWSLRQNRTWLRAALAATPSTSSVPLLIDGTEIQPDEVPEARRAVGIDPSAPEVVRYRWAMASTDDVDRAVDVARRAQTTWGETAPGHRAELLLRAGEVLAERRDQAIATMVRDGGKPVAEADPEVSEAIDMATYYAHQAVRLADLDAAHRPLGPVVVAPPWNFPYTIPAGGVFAALAAGDTVILKPAPETVLTGWLLASCIREAGIPTDVVQFLPCPDDDVGRRLITHPDVAAVVLTGSADTAQLFRSWRTDLRLHAETSGKNSMIVTAAADLDLAVRDVVRSAFGHAGQKCSAASVVIVEQPVLDEGRFVAKLADATRSLHVGWPSDPSVDVGPLIAPPNERLARALGRPAPGERWLVEPRQLDQGGHLWTPGIRTGVAPGSFLHRTECFGPVLALMAARDLDHAIDLQNDTDFGLTGGLHSLDPAEVERWLERVEVGNAYVNRSITGAIVGRQPFGGWKRSSVGPAAKAGGPDYVASLVSWTDRPSRLDDGEAGGRLARARNGYPEAWAELSRPSDPSALRAERNEHRHVALPSVLLRIDRTDPLVPIDPVDVELCLLAARTTGTQVLRSDAADESLAELRARWRRERPARLRVLGRVSDDLRRAAADDWMALDDRLPVTEGRIELPRWSREQAVSITEHRHGNVHPQRDSRRSAAAPRPVARRRVR